MCDLETTYVFFPKTIYVKSTTISFNRFIKSTTISFNRFLNLHIETNKTNQRRKTKRRFLSKKWDFVLWNTLSIVLWIFELDSNCVSYLLVLIHLVNIFDDNYFGNNNEVRFVYVYIYSELFMMIMIRWLWLW